MTDDKPEATKQTEAVLRRMVADARDAARLEWCIANNRWPKKTTGNTWICSSADAMWVHEKPSAREAIDAATQLPRADQEPPTPSPS